MKYAIIVHEDIPTLVKHVNAALKDGWQCTGGMAMVEHTKAVVREIRYAQAMIHTGVVFGHVTPA